MARKTFSRTSRTILSAASSSIALFAFTAPAQAQNNAADATQSQAAPQAVSDEVIVTASKREERLRDVPAAVTALGSAKLENLGVQSFRDYASLVPGLSQRDFGAPGVGTVILRGLNTGSQQTTNTSAFYIDEAPFTANGFLSVNSFLTPDLDLADVDRVEVLKGPQGTLYGASSLGGLIHVVTKRPDVTHFSGTARFEGTAIDGGGQGGSARAAINVPLIEDKLALRVVGLYRKTPGFTTNVGTGTRNVNDGEAYGGRVALRAKPTPQLTIDLSATIQNLSSNGYAYQDNVTDTLTPLYGKYKYSQIGDFGVAFKYRIYAGSVDYDLGHFGTFTTAVTYGKVTSDLRQDYTQVYGPLLGLPAAFNTGIPVRIAPNMGKWTVESRLASRRLGPVEFVAGLFYTHEDDLYFITLPGVNTVTKQPLPAPFNDLGTSPTVSTYQEYAAFGNVTLYLGDKVDVTGGVRVAHNDQHFDLSTTGLLLGTTATSYNFKDTKATFLGTLRWRPSRSLSFFVRAASGYRPGGPQTNPTPPAGAQLTIKPDTVWNYEAGVKGGTADGVFNFSASIYRIDWKDIQLNTLSGGILLLANGGDARVNGFEAEASVRPDPTFTVTGSFGYTDPKLKRVEAGVSAYTGAVVGDTLPLTPRYTAAITVDKAVPLTDTVKFDAGATLRFQSTMNSNFTQSLLNPNIKVPSVTTVDLRAGLSFGRYKAQVRVDNLLNEFGYTSLVTNKVFPGQAVPTSGTLIRPRAFTLSLSAAF